MHGDSRRITHEEMRESLYADYFTNKRKSLRRDKNKNPCMDKIGRLNNLFEGFRVSEIDADVIR